MLTITNNFLKMDASILTNLPTGQSLRKSPVHRWFPYLAGFSEDLVTKIIHILELNESHTVFDPFMGSGTVAVECRKHNITTIGHEINPFVLKVSKAKTNFTNNAQAFTKARDILIDKSISQKFVLNNSNSLDPLFQKCYSNDFISKLYTLKSNILSSKSQFNNLLFLALSNTLRESAKVKISHPYISWNSTNQAIDPIESFLSQTNIMIDDMKALKDIIQPESKSVLYLKDSRNINEKIASDSMDCIITSPPYLNNFDYGEFTKVYTHFWDMTKNWNDITTKIRHKGVTFATTCYSTTTYKDTLYENILNNDFKTSCPKSSQMILEKVKHIHDFLQSKTERKKSFDLLVLLYFNDIYKVLLESYRVLKHDHYAFFVIGDSAPYGVHIPTDYIMKTMANELGFSQTALITLRQRGAKWKTLKNRHSLDLQESLVILKK